MLLREAYGRSDSLTRTAYNPRFKRMKTQRVGATDRVIVPMSFSKHITSFHPAFKSERLALNDGPKSRSSAVFQ